MSVAGQQRVYGQSVALSGGERDARKCQPVGLFKPCRVGWGIQHQGKWRGERLLCGVVHRHVDACHAGG